MPAAKLRMVARRYLEAQHVVESRSETKRAGLGNQSAYARGRTATPSYTTCPRKAHASVVRNELLSDDISLYCSA
eukprot:6104621-Pleurochrysis_carterae.AAC.2